MRYEPREMVDEGRYLVAMSDVNWVSDHDVIFTGSFQVAGARLLGLSYPDYLRFLQSRGGILKGKQGYCYAYFKNKVEAQKVCDMLNKIWKEMESGL